MEETKEWDQMIRRARARRLAMEVLTPSGGSPRTTSRMGSRGVLSAYGPITHAPASVLIRSAQILKTVLFAGKN